MHLRLLHDALAREIRLNRPVRGGLRGAGAITSGVDSLVQPMITVDGVQGAVIAGEEWNYS